MDTLLSFKNVDAGYGRVKVLSDLNFEVYRGEVFGVIGPNGCGKTTMFNALIGLIQPTKGEIHFDGHNITNMSANARCNLGLGRTYQVPRPFENMSVFENVLVAAVHGAGLSEQVARPECQRALEITGLYDKHAVRSGELTLLDRKRLEIARALGTAPKNAAAGRSGGHLTEAKCRMSWRWCINLKAEGFTSSGSNTSSRPWLIRPIA